MDDKNLHNENLESFFQKAFKKQDATPPDADGWDTPDDGLWASIEGNIEQKPAPHPRLMLWRIVSAAAVLLLLVLFYQFIQRGEQVTNLANAIENNKEVIKDLKDQLEDKKNLQETKKTKLKSDNQTDIPVQENTEIVETPNSQQQTTLAAKGNNDQRIKKSIHPNQQVKQTLNSPNTAATQIENRPTQIPEAPLSIGNSNDLDLLSSESQNKIVNNSTEQSTQLNTPKEASDKTVKTIVSATKRLDSKAILLAESDETTITNFLAQNPAVKIEPIIFKKKVNGFYVGIFAGPQHASRSMKIEGPMGKLIRDRFQKEESTKFATNIGMKLGLQLNKNWSIESGIAYSKVKSTGRNVAEIRYSAINESENTDGELEKQYAYDIKTSYGDIETDIALARSTASNVSEDTPIPLLIESMQELSFLNIPLAARFHVGGSKFRFGLKAGLQANILVDSDFEITAIRSMHQELRFKRVNHNNRKKRPDLNTFTMNYMAGLSFEYALSKNLRFAFEPTFTKSLTSIAKAGSRDELKIFPRSTSINAGLTYYF